MMKKLFVSCSSEDKENTYKQNHESIGENTQSEVFPLLKDTAITFNYSSKEERESLLLIKYRIY